ncbi:MAG: hypothetical protein KatS3mg131_3233 [Candidatus Tectimicrobiota bacterium]|nr:MAG: hypothetical protein KatS3mg131_3233 [Candidatus Tectomicrobia bacterium]
MLFPVPEAKGDARVSWWGRSEAWEKIHTAFNEVELHLITGILGR